VRLSAGQHIRSHSSKNMAVSASVFERNSGMFEHGSALRLCQGARARTQMRDGRSQLGERPGIGGSAFDRKHYVRPHCQHLIFLETETES
jgi:hypothetical protein